MTWLLLACREPEPHPPPPHSEAPECGLPDRSDPSTARQRTPTVRVQGTWSLNLGESTPWVADVDRDGCEEVIAGEARAFAADYRQAHPAERVVVVRGAAVSGPTTEVLVATDDALDTYATMGYRVAFLAGIDQLFVAVGSGEPDVGLASFDFPLHDTSWSDSVGQVSEVGKYHHVADTSLAGCGTLGGRPAVVAAALGRTDDNSLGEGAVHIFDAPLVGDLDEYDAASLLVGHPGDYHPYLACDDDLDGDGATDLAVGFLGADRVAILSNPPRGKNLVWEVATAIVEGDPSTGFGENVALGDLDGDGSSDVWAGAKFAGDGGLVAGCRGPFTVGEVRRLEECEWIIRGNPEDGLDAPLIGDFDGDGVADLAVAAPDDWVYGTGPGGRVDVYRGPLAPGVYSPDDADLVLRSAGAPGNDWFGWVLRAGDLDGNGADDLVILAPYDRDAQGRPSGSIQILFGGPGLFP